MFCVSPVMLLISVILTIRKKKSKKWWVAFGISLLLFTIFELVAAELDCKHDYKLIEESPATCTEDGYLRYHCEKCGRDMTEYIDQLEHDLRIINRIEPTENIEGEIIRQCERCGYEEVESISTLPKETESSTAEVSEEVKRFAEENGISVELAQSVQDVLLETDIPDSLNILNGWEQTEDYAYGQRYIAQSYSLSQDKHFYVMFYVQDDEVVSVRDRKNGLEELWRK